MTVLKRRGKFFFGKIFFGKNFFFWQKKFPAKFFFPQKILIGEIKEIGQQKILVQVKIGPKRILVRKKFWVQNNFRPKEFLGTLGNRVKFGAYGWEGWGDQFLSLR